MKTKLYSLAMAAFLTTNGLIAHDVSVGTITHEHPKFKSVTETMEFDDGTVVVWQAEENASSPTSDKVAYTATIIQPTAKPVTYSLLTLGVQSIRHDVFIESTQVDSGSVLFAAPGDFELVVKPGPVFVPRIGVKADPSAPLQESLDKDRIWFISFSAKVCVLKVKAANRKIIGVTNWMKAFGSVGSSHDNLPPPPNSD